MWAYECTCREVRGATALQLEVVEVAGGSGGPPSKGAENHTRVSGRIASAIATKTSLQPQPRKVLLLQTMLG